MYVDIRIQEKEKKYISQKIIIFMRIVLIFEEII